jgi:hypothetical protein
MSTIDRQRIAAVKALEAMGYRFRDDKWLAPTQTADRRKLTPCTRCLSTARISWRGASRGRRRSRSSAIVSAIVAYEQRRWPGGKTGAAKASCLAPVPSSASALP